MRRSQTILICRTDMLYMKILRFTGNRAICATDIGKDLDIRRALLPVTASVGDSFKIGLNETYDGLTYTQISDKEHRKHRQEIKSRRDSNADKSDKTDPVR